MPRSRHVALTSSKHIESCRSSVRDFQPGTGNCFGCSKSRFLGASERRFSRVVARGWSAARNTFRINCRAGIPRRCAEQNAYHRSREHVEEKRRRRRRRNEYLVKMQTSLLASLSPSVEVEREDPVVARLVVVATTAPPHPEKVRRAARPGKKPTFRSQLGRGPRPKNRRRWQQLRKFAGNFVPRG